jgi:3-oxoacyl-[acyl-carrier protein] reductase
MCATRPPGTAFFAEAVETFGHIDVAMNIAGMLLSSWAQESPVKEIDLQIDVNVKGVIYGTRVAAQHMLPRGQGHIINIASIAGVLPVPGLAVYAASKHAVRAYSLSAALEFRPKGLYVTAVCPATVQTAMLDNQEKIPAAELYFSGLRVLTVEDIEHAILDRALVHKPYEVFVPRFKVRLFQIVGIFPWLGPLFSPIYQWTGRRRQAKHRKLHGETR